mmetsp:Transcript_37890/g.83061  ORF Transcript_37890/g.83061 Transcript_37890/m.83061 type:complete len:343 (+) Transcript_37890:197-1225(+)
MLLRILMLLLIMMLMLHLSCCTLLIVLLLLLLLLVLLLHEPSIGLPMSRVHLERSPTRTSNIMHLLLMVLMLWPWLRSHRVTRLLLWLLLRYSNGMGSLTSRGSAATTSAATPSNSSSSSGSRHNLARSGWRKGRIVCGSLLSLKLSSRPFLLPLKLFLAPFKVPSVHRAVDATSLVGAGTESALLATSCEGRALLPTRLVTVTFTLLCNGIGLPLATATIDGGLHRRGEGGPTATSGSSGSTYSCGTPPGGRPITTSGMLAVAVVPFTGIMQEAELRIGRAGIQTWLTPGGAGAAGRLTGQALVPPVLGYCTSALEAGGEAIGIVHRIAGRLALLTCRCAV